MYINLNIGATKFKKQINRVSLMDYLEKLNIDITIKELLLKEFDNSPGDTAIHFYKNLNEHIKKIQDTLN